MKRWVLYLFCSIITICGIGQTNFSIKVEGRSIARNEILQVEYAVTNADVVNDFKEPIFSGWKVLSGPMMSRQFYSVNNNSQKIISYVYVLQPERSGQVLLPGTSVVADGRKRTCPSVMITVSKKNAANPQSTGTLPSLFEDMPSLQNDDQLSLRPGERVEDKMKQLVFIRAEVSKQKCFVGEPVQVVYKLYTALRPELQVNKQPSFTGASVIELPFDEFPQNTTINGKAYRVYTFRKVQLTPLQTGTIELQKASVKATIQYVTTTDYSQKSSSVLIESTPAVINVEPLPLFNGKEFNGPIGQFSLILRADNDTVAAGATNALIIELNGAGNFQNMPEPAVEWPAGIDHYDATEQEEISKNGFPVEGRKWISIPFVSNRTGVISFKPVSITYFNTVNQRYETISSNDLKVLVTDAVNTSDVVKNDNPGLNGRKYVWLVPLIALIAGFILIITNKRSKRIGPAQQQKVVAPTEEEPAISPVQLIQEQLSSLSSISDQAAFLSACRQVLKDAVFYYGRNMDQHEYVILEQLHRTEPQLFSQHTDLVKRINEALYAPVGNIVGREEMIATTTDTAERLMTLS